MKTLLLSVLILIGMECALRADPRMNFDDSASINGGPVGAGYHLLNWNNFYFLNASNYTGNPSGYYAGMVSPDFVIYNGFGAPASISAGMFDLLSVDATAAWNDGLVLEAKGYFKGTLLYDQTSILSATSPNVITYDFYGVDEVDFTSSGGTFHSAYTNGAAGTQFVFDNLKVNTYLPYRPGLLANGGFETGNFTGWEHFGNTNDTWVTNTPAFVRSGSYGLEIGPVGTPGEIAQEIIPTQINQLYTISFWLENTTNLLGQTPNSLVAYWGGVPVFGLTNVGAFGWTNISFDVPATRLDEFFELQIQNDPAFFGLDDVSVTPAVLLSNGGFETGNFSGWGQFGNLINDNVVGLAAHVGNYGGEFGAVGSLGFIEQDIVTQPGQPYLLSAWLNNVWAGPQTNQFKASWTSQVLADDTNLPDAGWTNLHYTVLNENTENTLFFGFRNDPSFFYFDEASVWPVPIVANGGFEFGDFTGWTTSGRTNYFSVETNANSGFYAGQFGPTNAVSHLSQTLSTVPGQAYLVGFMLNNLESESSGLDFTVSWNGTVLMELTNLSLSGWIPYEFAVTATGTSTTLQFGFRNDPGFWGLDDVFVSPITPPEFQSIVKTNPLVTMTWNEMPGYTYEVQYTTNLTQTNWTTLQTYFLETNVPMTTIDTNPPDPQRFYRVKMIPPPLLF